ncbi:MAG: (d)CMP kinase [Saprospiraceae bacterium]|nr:(d)CMP kinase [Saprospiraceae bacterium]
MSDKHFIIAIDGYSACGKSTLAKELANALQVRYLDSGALYRAITLFCIRHIIHPEDEKSVIDCLQFIQLKLDLDNPIKITLNQENVTDEIRMPEVTRWVSEISVIPQVRLKVNDILRETSVGNSIIMDGRDIGTVVFPNADIKFFITADIQIRALRRQRELVEQGRSIDLTTIKENLLHRDHLDSTRMDSPLRKAEDSIVIDNTLLDRKEQLDLALNIIKSKIN